MKETDLRKQPDDVRNHMRKQAIRLMKAGKIQQEIADKCGVHLNTVGSWWRNYQKEGKKALHVKKRGLKSGQGRVLTAEQEKEIRQMIIDKTPVVHLSAKRVRMNMISGITNHKVRCGS